MNKNSLQQIYDGLNKINKWVTSKVVINIFFIFCSFFMISGVALIITGISLSNIDKNIKEIIAILGASIFGFFFIVFYVFEYLRRKTDTKIFKRFNFIDLCSEFLNQNGIIDKQPYEVDEYKSIMINEHISYAKRQNTERNISREWLLYALECKGKTFFYSQSRANEIDSNKKFKVNNLNQVILSYKNNGLSPMYIYSSEKDYSKFSSYKFKNVINEFTVLSNSENGEYTNFLDLMDNLKKIGIIVDVKIDEQFIYYIFTIHNNFLSLLPSYKFYKTTWNDIFINYSKDLEKFLDILKLL